MTVRSLPVAVRGYVVQPGRAWAGPAWPAPPKWPRDVLAFDTECTTDQAQRLLFGCYRIGRWDAHGALVCREEGLFYADDLPERDPEGFALLKEAIHKEPGLRLYSRRDWLDEVFYPMAYGARALVVAFNMLFDLGRIASKVGRGRRSARGGFSFTLFERLDPKTGRYIENRYRPRITYLPLDARRATVRFSRTGKVDPWEMIPEGSVDGRPVDGYRFRGRFLDLHTLTHALTDKSMSLRRACEALGVGDGKADAGEHGRITAEYIRYCRQDVRASQALLVKLRAEFDRHPVALLPDQARSPASIAKAYLRAAGITSPLRRSHLSNVQLGAGTSAYFGGRAECRIRRTPVPVVLTDFTSMYPTVSTLMGLERLLKCERIEAREATDDIRQLLSEVALDRYFEPAAWRQLAFFAKVRPSGHVLPVRAQYGLDGGYTIGINHVTSDKPLWVSGPDAVAAVLLTGRPIEVVEAFRLEPVGVAAGLAPIHLGGRVRIDPRTDDLFRTMIEERKRVHTRPDLSGVDRARLDAFLKVNANSGSYGIFAEMNRQELPKGKRATVTVFAGEQEFACDCHAPENPGAFCFPPYAALVTGGARLMLALLERCVIDAAGTYAFCDTDSLAIVATEQGGLVPCIGGPLRMPDGHPAIRTLSWPEVDAIVRRFEQLNPYARDAVAGSILKVEDVNYPCDANGKRIPGAPQREIFCFAISAKRYCLYTVGPHDSIVVEKASESGLGVLLNPCEPQGAASRGEHRWVLEVWKTFVERALGRADARWPEWADLPAVAKLPISKPALLEPFAVYNARRPYEEQVKPGNFLLSPQVAALGHPRGTDPSRFHLVGSFDADPRRWLRQEWVDRYSGVGYRIRTDEPAGLAASDVVTVKSYREVFEEYEIHPEAKSDGPDGRPCAKETVGLLQRAHVRPATVTAVGKESNALEEIEAGIVHEWDEVRNIYRDTRRSVSSAVDALLADGDRATVARALGVAPCTVSRWRHGRQRPRSKSARRIHRASPSSPDR